MFFEAKQEFQLPEVIQRTGVNSLLSNSMSYRAKTRLCKPLRKRPKVINFVLRNEHGFKTRARTFPEHLNTQKIKTGLKKSFEFETSNLFLKIVKFGSHVQLQLQFSLVSRCRTALKPCFLDSARSK